LPRSRAGVGPIAGVAIAYRVPSPPARSPSSPLPIRLDWKAGPDVHEAEHLARHDQGIIGVTPPVGAIIAVRRRSHNCAHGLFDQRVPGRPYAPRVNFRGHDDDDSRVPPRQLATDEFDLIEGIDDFAIKEAD